MFVQPFLGRFHNSTNWTLDNQFIKTVVLSGQMLLHIFQPFTIESTFLETLIRPFFEILPLFSSYSWFDILRIFKDRVLLKIQIFWTDFNHIWIFPPKWHKSFTKSDVSARQLWLKLKFCLFEIVRVGLF